MPTKVIIMGGGIGGLTVAHELSHFPEYEIHVYEKNDCLGGMARSGHVDWHNLALPTEYCWRIYGPNYNNLRSILKQIPFNNTQTVHDNLIDITQYLIADQNTILTMTNRPSTLLQIRKAFKKVPFSEKWQVFNKIFYGFMISTSRLNSMDNEAWCDYINPNHRLSHDMKKYIVDIMGPYLGAEPTKVNVPSVIKTLESFKMWNGPLSVMNGPTSERWFKPWQDYLEKQGVTFHFNASLHDLKITHSTVEAAITQEGSLVKGDLFFCSLPVEAAAQLLSSHFPSLEKLAARGHQLMVGMQLYFNKKITLPFQNTALYIPDSHWQLVIEPQGSIWDAHYGDIADMWSIGLCDPLTPGLLIQKPFVQCSHEEIAKEVWHQIKHSEFRRYLKLDDIDVLHYNVWNSYLFNGQRLHTNEPKFSTNKGTYFLRPQNATSLNNLYFATGYTQTDTDMFEMESAAESGKRAAKHIENAITVFGINRPLLFAPYQWLDSILYRFNLYSHHPVVFFFLGLPLLLLLPLFYFKRKIKR